MNNGFLLVNNAEKFEESVLNLQFFSAKGKLFEEIKRNYAGKIKCVPGISDYKDSMFGVFMLDCIC